jgi:phenylacetic acid degradation operon negative regulatory protein
MRREGRSNYVRVTARSLQRVDEAAKRIYRLQSRHWDERWFLLTYSIPEAKRKWRDQLRNDLSWLGFGMLGAGVWITPHNLEVQARNLAESYGLNAHVDFFSAYHRGPESSQLLTERCWDLAAVNARYAQFLERFRPLYLLGQQQLTAATLSNQQCFIKRSWLVHEYRKFLHVDPALPEQLLSENWLGSEAFDLFHAYDRLLATGAGHYFYQLFANAPSRSQSQAALSPAKLAQALEAQLDPFSVANA